MTSILNDCLKELESHKRIIASIPRNELYTNLNSNICYTWHNIVLLLGVNEYGPTILGNESNLLHDDSNFGGFSCSGCIVDRPIVNFETWFYCNLNLNLKIVY